MLSVPCGAGTAPRAVAMAVPAVPARDKGSLRGDTEEGRARERGQPGLSPAGFIPRRGCLRRSQSPYWTPTHTLPRVLHPWAQCSPAFGTADLGKGHSCPGAGDGGRCWGSEGEPTAMNPKPWGTHTWQLFPGCLGTATPSSRTGKGPWVQNLAVMGSLGRGAMGTRGLGEDAQSIL